MPEKKEIEAEDKTGKTGEVEIEFITEKKKPKKDKAEETKSLQGKLKKSREEISHLKKEVEKFKEEYLRQLADKDNLRKRLERDKEDFYKYSQSEFLKELLGILDNFERALESQDNEDSENFRHGVELICKQFQDLLFKQGIKPIEKEGDKFNPQVQLAFMTEESDDVQEPTVIEELQRGYMLHDRLLRPAMVKVLLPKK